METLQRPILSCECTFALQEQHSHSAAQAMPASALFLNSRAGSGLWRLQGLGGQSGVSSEVLTWSSPGPRGWQSVTGQLGLQDFQHPFVQVQCCLECTRALLSCQQLKPQV
jgi:hypothetical protein